MKTFLTNMKNRLFKKWSNAVSTTKNKHYKKYCERKLNVHVLYVDHNEITFIR